MQIIQICHVCEREVTSATVLYVHSLRRILLLHTTSV